MTVHFPIQDKILITIHTNAAEYRLTKPRKFIVKNGFGAETHRAWLEVYNQDLPIPAQPGDHLRIMIDGKLCFQGLITQRRLDSVDDYITYLAEWDPKSEYDTLVHLRLEGQSLADGLRDLISDAGLSMDSDSQILLDTQATQIVNLEFSNKTLFDCIDLLAKLAGNWLWDMTLTNELRFRPANHMAEQFVYLKQDHYVINLRQNLQPQFTQLLVEGGLVGEEPIELVLDLGQPALNDDVLKVIARSIVSLDGLTRLATAIIQQWLRPNYSHYIDIFKQGWNIQSGETVHFLVGDYPLFPIHDFFRVTQRELTYTHEQITTRLYLTSGYESTNDYFEHLNKELPMPGYMIGRIGPFQLDVSALDTPAHLDGAT